MFFLAVFVFFPSRPHCKRLHLSSKIHYKEEVQPTSPGYSLFIQWLSDDHIPAFYPTVIYLIYISWYLCSCYYCSGGVWHHWWRITLHFHAQDRENLVSSLEVNITELRKGGWDNDSLNCRQPLWAVSWQSAWCKSHMSLVYHLPKGATQHYLIVG